MRILPTLTALIVVAFLYVLVFERDLLFTASDPAASEAASDTEVAAAEEAASEPEAAPDDGSIKVVIVESVAREIDSAVELRGRTEASRQVEVRSETTGQVISEPLRRGAFVEVGQLVCQLDPGIREANLAEARARLAEATAGVPAAEGRVLEARAALDEALINDNAASRLSEDGFASETRVAQTRAGVEAARAATQSAESGLAAAQAAIESAQAGVAAAEKEIERLEIRAPFSGLLETDAAELGSLLQAGSPCVTILQLNPMKIVGFVPEVDVDRVELGALAGARLVSGREVQGEVTFISRQADMTTRTFRVEINVDNSDLTLRDGQTANILITAEGTQAHLLPGSALTLNAEGALGVRIADDDDITRFVEVQLLRDTPNGVLLSGLAETARVIVVGQEFVTDGVPVAPTVREQDS
ncbi:MAG: efflux RND transporter periplasmic adaptor subunit [Rhodobacteraceae bacterium]|nr:efflux RND transporter periplasmic adaptor subunit [Paracoccaceae bacterium]